MSLTVDGKSRGRDRSRSRSRDRRPKEDLGRLQSDLIDDREPIYTYPEDDFHGYDRSTRRRQDDGRLPFPLQGGLDDMLPGPSNLYRYDAKSQHIRAASSSQRPGGVEQLPGSFPEESRDELEGHNDSDTVYKQSSAHQSSRHDRREKPEDRDARNSRLPQLNESFASSRYTKEDRDRDGDRNADKLKFLPRKYNFQIDSDKEGSKRDRPRPKAQHTDDRSYERGASNISKPDSPPTYGSYIPSSRFGGKETTRYSPRSDHFIRPSSSSSDELETHEASEDRRGAYRDTRHAKTQSSQLPANQGSWGGLTSRRRDHSRNDVDDVPRGSSVLVAEPGRRDRDRSRDRRHGIRERSPLPPTSRLSTLSVEQQRPSGMSIAAAPGSPLLESYQGTYQDCSPMPSPLLLASKSPPDERKIVDSFSPLNSDSEGDTRKWTRRARFHDPEDSASRLAAALRGTKPPDIEPLVEILPSLTHDQVMELRAEYKQLVKTGSERRGVNIAKHIRARLKDEDPVFMKACYSVALGIWESEAYWANFWYQGDKTRRELLIETLVGRTNDEIRSIKGAFTDKKYDNSLSKCMKTELKEDKFKKAILTVLEERKMEEFDTHGRLLPLDLKLVDQDVDDLRHAVRSEKGGESLMISIILQRSDSHLRAILKQYERNYHGNFAREALQKSGNLVGELLAHILNGIINRPVRDALLLHHAVSTSRKDNLRRELLVSRLVRYHWDPVHMQAVKIAYRERYGRDLQDAVREATNGLWGRFCRELCIARMPNDVRRVERVHARK